MNNVQKKKKKELEFYNLWQFLKKKKKTLVVTDLRNTMIIKKMKYFLAMWNFNQLIKRIGQINQLMHGI